MKADIRSVAVFRALQLGDLLCAVPALRALRAALPLARITLIGLPWAGSFAARFKRYLDDFLPFPGHPGLPEQPPDTARFARFVARARARRFDLAIQLHGSGRVTNRVVAQLGAAALAGFCPEAPGSEAFLVYPHDAPEIRRLLALMQFLGAPPLGEALEFPLYPEDEAELARFAEERRLPRGAVICLHPGARAAERRWPPERFAAVGDALHERYRLPVVLTGSEPERDLTAAVIRAMRAPAFDAAGAISAGALAAQLARARAVVTNDTGVSHLAAALRLPSVTVFRASEMRRWAPLDARLHRAVWDPGGTRLEEVLAHARSLLEARPSATAPAQA